MKYIFRFILYVAVLAAVVFLFPVYGTKETGFERSWVILPEKSSIGQSSAEKYSYHLGRFFGQFSNDGILLSRTEADALLQISDEHFITNDRILHSFSTNSPIQLPESFFPMLQGDQLYLLHSKGRGIMGQTFSGDTLWEVYLESPITSLSQASNRTVFGSLTGQILVLNSLGSVLLDTRLTEVAFPVIYATAISERYVAVLGGSQPLRFVLFSLQNGTFRQVANIPLEQSLISEVPLEISQSQRLISWTIAENHFIYDISRKNLALVKTQEPLMTAFYGGNELGVLRIFAETNGGKMYWSRDENRPFLEFSSGNYNKLLRFDREGLLLSDNEQGIVFLKVETK
jgi:hypothetical protein